MLVPFRVSRPPPALADTICTPGALKVGSVFEKFATLNCPPCCCRAPTATTSSAAAGIETEISNSGR